MKHLQTVVLAAIALMPMSSFAIMVKAEPVKLDSKRVAPIQDNQKTYTYDQSAVKTIADGKSSLIKVNCDNLQILKSIGFTQNTSNMFSIGLNQDGFDYNFDLRNCSLRGAKVNQQWSGKPVTEAQALAAAKAFMGSQYLANKIFTQYGAPIIIARNNNTMRPMYEASLVKSADGTVFSGIDIDPTDTGDVQPQYTSFSILFPYVINGKAVYNNYGNKAGISVEVTADGVTSMNAQLLPFKGASRNADKMSADDFGTYIKKGGNNPYRGQETKVALGKPQSVLVLFSLRRNNTTELYLSSGIKFTTNLKPDQWAQQPYEMTLSDYKIGNNNYGY